MSVSLELWYIVMQAGCNMEICCVTMEERYLIRVCNQGSFILHTCTVHGRLIQHMTMSDE